MTTATDSQESLSRLPFFISSLFSLTLGGMLALWLAGVPLPASDDPARLSALEFRSTAGIAIMALSLGMADLFWLRFANQHRWVVVALLAVSFAGMVLGTTSSILSAS